MKQHVYLLLLVIWVSPQTAGAAGVDGFTEPNRLINVAAAETGVITRLDVREGDRVRAGQLLAALDLDVLQAALAVAQARANARGAIQGAKAERDLWRVKVAKLRTLRADGHLSASEMERAEADLAVAEAKLVAALEEQRIAALECKRIETQIERRRIRSPIDGIVIKLRKETGEAILLSDPAIVTLVELDRLRARFSMSYAQASRVRTGQAVTLALPETRQQAAATVEVVAPVSDAKSGTVQVTVVMDNRDGRYRSGMRCVWDVPDGHPLANAGQ